MRPALPPGWLASMAESTVCENAPWHDVWCDDVRCGVAPPERERGPDDRVSWQWIAPLLSTLVTPFLAFWALLFIPLFTPGSVVFRCALALPLGLLIAAWAMPRRRRHIGRRVLYASLAPASVFVLYMSCARPMPNP